MEKKRNEAERAIRDNASHQLVKLADLMETCDYGDRQWRYYQSEYRKYAKILFPEAYKKKSGTTRKPSAKFVNTLLQCSCGSDRVSMNTDKALGVSFDCPDCSRAGAIGKNKSIARDNWNKTFDN